MSPDPGVDPTVDVVQLIDAEPGLFFGATFLVAGVVGGLLFLAIRAITKAGNVQPPVVVVTLVLGIVLILIAVVIALRPDLGDVLAPLLGAGVGGLASALASSFSVRKKDSTYEPPPPAEGGY